jgi:hypothetical protein
MANSPFLSVPIVYYYSSFYLRKQSKVKIVYIFFNNKAKIS